MKIVKANITGIELIKKYEAFRSRPYLDAAGIPTIGYGATYYPGGKRVSMSDKAITEQKATEMLVKMLRHYELGVDRYTRDDITQNQFNALVSFAYNVGLEALRTSTLLRKINNRESERAIRKEFARWKRAGGRVLRGLARRRQEEANLFFS